MIKDNRITSAMAAAAALAVLLGGCSSDGVKPGAEVSPSAELPSADPTVKASDGGEIVTDGEVNEDFPAKKVPVIEGKVLSSASSPEDGFNVIVLVDGDTKSASKKAVKQLKSAGFKVESKRAAGGAVVTGLTSPKFTVELAATPTGNQSSVNYVVTPR